MTLKDFITKPELLVIYKNKIQVELVNKTLVPCIFYFSLYENRFRKRWITITNDWERESSIKLYRYHIIYYILYIMKNYFYGLKELIFLIYQHIKQFVHLEFLIS